MVTTTHSDIYPSYMNQNSWMAYRIITNALNICRQQWEVNHKISDGLILRNVQWNDEMGNTVIIYKLNRW